MACNSISALPLNCQDGIISGLEKVYMVAYKDIASYSASTSNIINSITMASGKTFVEIGINPETSGINETLTKDVKLGVAFWSQEFKLILQGLSASNKEFVKNVMMQPVAVIVKTIMGDYIGVGFNGQCILTAGASGTGIERSSLQGFDLTFTSASLIPSQNVESATALSVIA